MATEPSSGAVILIKVTVIIEICIIVIVIIKIDQDTPAFEPFGVNYYFCLRATIAHITRMKQTCEYTIYVAYVSDGMKQSKRLNRHEKLMVK